MGRASSHEAALSARPAEPAQGFGHTHSLWEDDDAPRAGQGRRGCCARDHQVQHPWDLQQRSAELRRCNAGEMTGAAGFPLLHDHIASLKHLHLIPNSLFAY